jgi:ABC-type branched-subunit amino acid transport system substrate-binding protein
LFGYSDWQETIKRIKAFGAAGKKTAVISTVNGDTNTSFYKELAAQKVDPAVIPIMAFSVGERKLFGVDTTTLIGEMATWNYFQSVVRGHRPVFTLVQSRLMTRWVAGSRAVMTNNFASVASSG